MLKMRAECPLTLVADEQEGRVRIVDEVTKVRQDSTSGEHAVRRDDHVRPRRVLDRARCRDVVRGLGTRVVERVFLSREQCPHVVVEVLRVPAIDVRRLRGHRRVQIERKPRDAARFEQPIELPDNVLGPTHCERRNEQHATGVAHRFHRLGEDGRRL